MAKKRSGDGMIDFIRKRRDELVPENKINDNVYNKRVKARIIKELQELIDSGVYGVGEDAPKRPAKTIVIWYFSNYLKNGMVEKIQKNKDDIEKEVE